MTSVLEPEPIDVRDLLGSGTRRDPKWVKVIDQTKCIGCHACTTACKSENEVPVGVTRTYVKSVDVGFFPQARRAFQVTRCNQCVDAPCAAACPTAAMFVRDDGIVDFDKRACIGCKACIAACPYDAIFINPEDHSAEKCNFCAHRIDVGLEPACVVVCPTEAILVGDAHDPAAKVSQITHRRPVTVRRPEKATKPKLFYVGGNQAALDPIAALRPPNGMYMWSEQGTGVASGHPRRWQNSSAAAVLSYDVPHKAPWDYRVSLYTWTKSIAAGAYLVPILLAVLGLLDWSGTTVRWAAPLLSLVFLGITGAVLIWDLEHPERLFYIFTRPQWKSWLVRGGVIITGFGAALALHLLGSILGSVGLQQVVAIAGFPLGFMVAVYTAFLFGQSKARDLWQSPLLAPHIAAQAVMAGAAALLLVPAATIPGGRTAIAWTLVAGVGAHLLFVWSEAVTPHGTAHAKLAAWEMTRGTYRTWFWAGVALAALALAAPAAPVPAAVAALVGLGAFEHAFVQAGQAVPLA